MAINPGNLYPGKTKAPDADYPYGSARNVTTPGDGTGTPWEAALVNDIFGFQQALLDGAGLVPSGTPERVGSSQYLNALRALSIFKYNAAQTYQAGQFVTTSEALYRLKVGGDGSVNPDVDDGTNWERAPDAAGLNRRPVYFDTVELLRQTVGQLEGQPAIITGTGGYGQFSVYWAGASTAPDDGRDVFAVDGEVTGRWLRVPSLRTSDDPDDYIFPSLKEGTDIIAKGGAGSPTESYREIGNVLFDPEAPSDERYKFVYSAVSGTYAQDNVFVGWAKSADGKTWVNEGLLSISRAAEDPYVLKHNGVYYLYAEDKEIIPFTSIRLYTSTDFVTWVDEGNALDPVAGGWEAQDVSSPVVFVEDDTFYMLYEGRATGQGGAVGLATSTDGVTWTRNVNNPVVTGFNDTFGYAGDLKWAQSVVPDDIRKVDGRYIFVTHAVLESETGGLRFLSGILSSSDLENWRDELKQPAGTFGQATVMFLETNSGVLFLATSDTGIGMHRLDRDRNLHISLVDDDGTALTAGVFTDIVYTRERIGAEEWDLATSEFTAKVGGVYQFECLQAFNTTSTDRGRTSIQLEVDGSTTLNLFSGDITWAASTVSGSYSIYLYAGQKVKFKVFADTSTGITTTGTGRAFITRLS